MVSRLDNNEINTRFRSHNDVNPINIPPHQALIAILDSLRENQEELVRQIQRNQIDVDIYGNDSGTTGAVTLQNNLRQPILITDVVASWQPSTSITATQAISTFTLGASPSTMYNNNPIPVIANVTGGAVTSIAVNGTVTGLTSGNIVVPAGGFITITYTTAPTVNTFAIPGFPAPTNTSTSPTTVTIKIKDRVFYGIPTSGIFVASSIHGMQSDIHETYSITTSPAVPCTLEIMGYADPRRIDQN